MIKDEIIKKVAVILSGVLFSLITMNCAFAQKHLKNDESIAIPALETKNHPYSSLRIPALVVTQKGTLLAFAAGRNDSGRGSADMEWGMRRSTDGGGIWQPVQVNPQRANKTPAHNPTQI